MYISYIIIYFLNIKNRMFIEQSLPTQSQPFSSNVLDGVPITNQQILSAPVTRSKVYPSLIIMPNEQRQFICQYRIPAHSKSIHINDPRIHVYYAAISKLFAEIVDSIDIKDFWICEKDTTLYPIHAYFTAPPKYPAMECCYQPIYVKFQHDLSGAVRCTQCNRIGFSFVHMPAQSSTTKLGKQNIRKPEQHKKHQKVKNKFGSMHQQNNYMNQKNQYRKTELNQISQILKQHKRQKQNEKIYKQQKLAQQTRKANIRKLISSNQHRYKSLKKFSMSNDDNKTAVRQSIINQYDDFYIKNKSNFNKSKRNNNQVSYIGQFIIQIENTKQNNIQPSKSSNKFNKQQWGLQSKKNDKQQLILQKQNANNHKYITKLNLNQKTKQPTQSQNLSQNCQQIKRIIQEIFS